MDDIPVGGGGNNGGGDPFANAFPDSAPPSNEPSNKTLEEKIVSKKWNERASAYEELTEKIKLVSKSKDPLLYDHAEGFKKYLKDNNPGALEKAVD